MSLQKELSWKNLISWSKSVFQLPKNRLITKTRVIISCEGLLQAVIEESAKGDGLYLWDAAMVGKWSNDQINTQNDCYH